MFAMPQNPQVKASVLEYKSSYWVEEVLKNVELPTQGNSNFWGPTLRECSGPKLRKRNSGTKN